MIYGIKKFKNGKKRGYLEFKTNKKVVILKEGELEEFEYFLNKVIANAK